VQKVLADWRTAPVGEKVRAALGFLEKLTLQPAEVTKADAQAALAAGISRQALEDAIAVCAGFCIIDRIADATSFHVPSPQDFAIGARALLKFGYKL
jgi:alkylhydroperoxidase family enzyme